jgi:hypothetical protein
MLPRPPLAGQHFRVEGPRAGIEPLFTWKVPSLIRTSIIGFRHGIPPSAYFRNVRIYNGMSRVAQAGQQLKNSADITALEPPKTLGPAGLVLFSLAAAVACSREP